MDVLTSETCWALNKVIKKEVTSSWSFVIKLSFVSYAFFHTEFKYVTRIAPSPTNFVWHNFLKCNFKDFVSFFLLSRFQCGSNKAGALHCTSNTAQAWKLHHNTDSRPWSPITDSQTVQAQLCTETLGNETNSKFRLRNTAVLVACRTALWKFVLLSVQCFV